MTRFLDCRMNSVGGELATAVAVMQGTNINNYAGLALGDLQTAVQGQNVLIATHGFNVDREAGIACLSNWETLLQPQPFPGVFIGLLWPGESVWAHGQDYADEPKVADGAGQLVAAFLNQNFAAAGSISFASHSLGARVVLQTINNLSLPVRRLTLMAGAVNDNCLTNEFQAAAAKVGEISVLASKKDEVLSALFPLGNFFAGIIDAGHPWWSGALGHGGPAQPWPQNFQAPFAIPENWNYQHGNYLEIDNPPAPPLPLPTNVPANGSQVLAPDVDANGKPIPGWSEEFSAAFVSTRFR